MTERKPGAALPDLGRPPTVQIQSILYNMDVESTFRSLTSLQQAAHIANFDKTCGRIKVSYGDTSAQRCLNEETVKQIADTFANQFEFSYRFFGENLGSAKGHNELAKGATSDFLLILNPDIVVSPRFLQHLLAAFKDRPTGVAEGKQIPIEHPKDYDVRTGATSWASTACALTPTALFHELGGFDSDTFFLYCDDVDYSWRVREAGYDVIFVPAAVVFHDKRIGAEGDWRPSEAERRYSAEAGLLMAYKWSRPDLVEQIANYFRTGNEYERWALGRFEMRQAQNTLPQPRDPLGKVAQFTDVGYAKHRFNPKV